MLYTVITVMVLGVVHRCQSLGERMSRDISQRNGILCLYACGGLAWEEFHKGQAWTVSDLYS